MEIDMMGAVFLAAYGEILAIPGVKRLLGFAVFARLPNAATSVVLTFWVVLGLNKGYGEAGLVVAASTAGSGLGSPWRGRLLDRVGLRRAVLPSVLVESVCWVLIPFASYQMLLVLGLVSGVMAIPTFNVVRQSISILVPADRQGSAFSLDSIGTEFTFMIAPAAGVVLATTWSALGAVIVLGVITVLAGVALLIVNPPLRSPDSASEAASSPEAGSSTPGSSTPGAVDAKAGWMQVFSREMVIVLIASAAGVAVLAGTEVAVVAFLRDRDQSELSAVVFTLWSVSSAIGGLLLGALKRPVPVFGVLLGLGLFTIPIGFAPGAWWLVLAILPSGFFCAPTLAATAATVSRLVPESIRGEAMGWYGTSTLIGLSLGAPVAGFAIDHLGAWSGFALIGALGTVVAVIGLVLVPWGIDRPDPRGSGAPSGVSPTRRLRSAD